MGSSPVFLSTLHVMESIFLARTSSYGFCAGVVDFLFLDAGFNCNHSSEVSSPVAGHFPGYMDYQVGMRSQIPIERKWALGIQTQLMLDQLADLQNWRSVVFQWKNC
ncbi:SNF1-related protein kinase catalytic subunit alpha [Arachis hypogaea]|nr:SNF1-related protein kinase catalytic subunit alpha [Arachis hypogaea]